MAVSASNRNFRKVMCDVQIYQALNYLEAAPPPRSYTTYTTRSPIPDRPKLAPSRDPIDNSRKVAAREGTLTSMGQQGTPFP